VIRATRGAIAAEVALEALLQDEFTADFLSRYEDRVKSSWIGEELRASRNFHQGFKGGLWAGLLHSGLQMATGGRGLIDPMAPSKGHAEMERLPVGTVRSGDRVVDVRRGAAGITARSSAGSRC